MKTIMERWRYEDIHNSGTFLRKLVCGRPQVLSAARVIRVRRSGSIPFLSLNRRRAACKLILTKSQTTFMSQSIQLEVEMPDDLARFRLPEGVQHRLQELLDKQDAGPALSPEEKREAEGLVDLADLLSLLQLRAERLNGGHA